MNFPTNFICADENFSTLDNHIPAPYFRKSFTVKEDLESAELLITALGYYEVYINGKNITKGFFAPYRSNINDCVYYDKYDLSDKLITGKNTVAVILGNGFRNALGAFVWDFDKADFRGAPATAFSIDLKYADETEETIISDTDTVTASSPIVFDDLHFGEYYNARLEIPNWNIPNFDDSEWKPAIKTKAPFGTPLLCEADPIVVRNTIKPVSVKKYENSYIYDFGVNSSGLCKLKISGVAGQKVLMQFFETLVDEKPCLTNFRFKPEHRFQEDEYYCKGTVTEEYTPRFTYHGFRYVQVSGITDQQATEDLLTYLELGSDISYTGSFSCSDEIVNKIQEATIRSDTSNFYYFPTDCPQREKNGWTADAALSAEQMIINLTPENSYKEWMRNIYKALSDEGKLPGIIPTGGWGYHWGNGPAWDNVIVYLPYFTYIYRGDKEILKELSIPLMRYLNYLFSRLDDKKLMCIGLGDWCPPSKSEDAFKAPLIVTDTILTYDIAQKAAFIYGELGQQPQKEFALSLAKTVRQAFRDNLLDNETLIVNGDCQTCQAMALFYGMFEESEKAKAFEYLLKLVDDADGHFDTGVLGGRVIYRVLAENGKADLAYNMIVRPDYPSYGNWIVRGATSLWESFQPEGGRILSLNHHFWGDVSAWFYIYLAGIRVNPSGKDVSNVDIKPCFIEKLTNVKASHNTPPGEIAVEWSRVEKDIILTVKADEKLHGAIELPDGYVFEDGDCKKNLTSGVYKVLTKNNYY